MKCSSFAFLFCWTHVATAAPPRCPWQVALAVAERGETERLAAALERAQADLARVEQTHGRGTWVERRLGEPQVAQERANFQQVLRPLQRAAVAEAHPGLAAALSQLDRAEAAGGPTGSGEVAQASAALRGVLLSLGAIQADAAPSAKALRSAAGQLQQGWLRDLQSPLWMAISKQAPLRAYVWARSRLSSLAVVSTQVGDHAVIELRNGRTVTGLVRARDPSSLVVNMPEKSETLSPKAIARVYPGTQALPDWQPAFDEAPDVRVKVLSSLDGTDPQWVQVNHINRLVRIVATRADTLPEGPPRLVFEVLGLIGNSAETSLGAVRKWNWAQAQAERDLAAPLHASIELHRALQDLYTADRTFASGQLSGLFSQVTRLENGGPMPPRAIAAAKYATLRRRYPPGAGGENAFWNDYRAGRFGLALEGGAGTFDTWATPEFRQQLGGNGPR